MVTKQVAGIVQESREVEVSETYCTERKHSFTNNHCQVVSVPDQLGAVAGALLQAVVASGAGQVLGQQLEARCRGNTDVVQFAEYLGYILCGLQY